MECKAVSGTLLHILALNINGYGFGILISLSGLFYDYKTRHTGV